MSAKYVDEDQHWGIGKGWTRVDEESEDGNTRVWRDVFVYRS